MKTILCAIFLLHSFCPNQSQAKSGSDVLKKSGLESGEYSVGFQLFEELDTSRMVTGGASLSSAHPRPIRIYLWYPAKDSNHAKPMRFGRYAELANEDILECSPNFRPEVC